MLFFKSVSIQGDNFGTRYKVHRPLAIPGAGVLSGLAWPGRELFLDGKSAECGVMSSLPSSSSSCHLAETCSFPGALLRDPHVILPLGAQQLAPCQVWIG